jgi:hypothetical protein
MSAISNESDEKKKCIYKRLFLDFRYGLNKIYTDSEIQQAMRSPSWEREYNLAYRGVEGNVFSNAIIDRALQLGNTYNPDAIIYHAPKALGIDPGFGSSKFGGKFGICLTQLANGRIEVLYCDEREREELPTVVSDCVKLLAMYGGRKVYIDAANPEVIRAFKREMSENVAYEKKIDELRRIRKVKDEDLVKFMNVVPVAFNPEGQDMLAHSRFLMDEGYVAIHPRFTKLIISLRTALSIENKLDKQNTAYSDTYDSFRLSLKYYRFPRPEMPTYQVTRT